MKFQPQLHDKKTLSPFFIKLIGIESISICQLEVFKYFYNYFFNRRNVFEKCTKPNINNPSLKIAHY